LLDDTRALAALHRHRAGTAVIQTQTPEAQWAGSQVRDDKQRMVI